MTAGSTRCYFCRREGQVIGVNDHWLCFEHYFEEELQTKRAQIERIKKLETQVMNKWATLDTKLKRQ